MLYLCYLCRFKPLRDHLRGFLIAAWAGDKIAEFSFPEISFHFPLRPWFFCKPRVCGEKLISSKHCLSISGSPPHVRGKARWWRWSWKITRITPACAGKRCSLRLCPRSSRDHPRMCGEKLRNHRIRQLGAGSPPHVRGKGTEEVIVIQVTGITPACAGKRREIKR